MEATGYKRKIDSVGRLVIPSKLRDKLGIVEGQEFEFIILEEDGKTYLGFHIPNRKDKLKEAMQILKENGLKVVTDI